MISRLEHGIPASFRWGSSLQKMQYEQAKQKYLDQNQENGNAMETIQINDEEEESQQEQKIEEIQFAQAQSKETYAVTQKQLQLPKLYSKVNRKSPILGNANNKNASKNKHELQQR